ncbi:membrane protein YpdK [Dickeya oryzae]
MKYLFMGVSFILFLWVGTFFTDAGITLTVFPHSLRQKAPVEATTKK